jgi:hypothetical protein
MRKFKFSKLSRTFSFLDKRQKFAIQTILLTVGLIITQLGFTDFRFLFIFFLALGSYVFTIWSLTEDVKGVEWLTLFILPVLFTCSVSLFYYLLPARMVVRLTTTIIFAVGTYAILLIENIYNVAAIRSIQLLRVAQSVGLLLSLVVLFLFSIIIYSLRLPFYLNFLVFIPITFFLALQSLWSMQLDSFISRRLFFYTGIVCWGIGSLSSALSFWPLGNSAYALFITASYYCLVSVIQLYLVERLFKAMIREYVIVFLFTFLLMIFVAKWGA